MGQTTISDVVEPSEEVLDDSGEITTDELLHDVELYNLYHDSEAEENDPDKIFDITYPTSVLRRIIETTTEKLSGELDNGAHVISGDYGSGKSHIGLVLHYLFENPDRGRDWLAASDIDVTLPAGADFHAFQMFNLEEQFEYLWEPVYHQLGAADQLETIGDVPSVRQIKNLTDEPTVLFIDELEPWLRMGARAEYREENLAFLQNLMAASNDGDNSLVTFVTLLYQDDDVTSRAGREGPHIHDLTVEDDEKVEFIIHRLIEERDHDAIDEVVDQYVDLYRENDQIEYENYQKKSEDIVKRYPFHPEILDLLMERFSEGGGHQDARGLLDFLTRVLADNFEETDLILTSDVDVHKQARRLRAVDPDLIPKYENDYDRLSRDGGFDEHVEELLNVVLLHSLVRAGKTGAGKRQRVVGVIRPGMTANEIERTFREKVYGRAWHIHRLNGEYSFDTDKNPSARIENRADDVTNTEAVQRIERLVTEDFLGDRDNVYVWHGVENGINIPDNKALKILVRLAANTGTEYTEDFVELTQGENREFHNTFAVLGPASGYDLTNTAGVLKVARRVVAGERLKLEEAESLPEEFYEIHENNVETLEEQVIEKFGEVYTPAEHEGETRLAPETTSADDGDLYDPVIEAVRPDVRQIRREVESLLDGSGEGGLQYQYLVNDFLRDVSFPTVVDIEDIETAVTQLCADGDIQVGDTIGSNPVTVADTDTLVHGRYVSRSEEGDDDVDEPETTTSATGSGTTTTAGGTSGTSGAGGASGGDSGVVTTVEPTSTDSETADPEQEGESEPEIVTVPAMGWITADNKFELEDTLERDVEPDWEIHEATVNFDGNLDSDELDWAGLDGHPSLTGGVNVEQSITLTPSVPIDRHELIEIVGDLNPPERAAFSVRLEVAKND